jgi:hypothetical protein
LLFLVGVADLVVTSSEVEMTYVLVPIAANRRENASP